MYNTYRFETKVWQLLCGRDGEKKKIGFVNKNRSRQKTKKCLKFFSDHLHIRIALGQYGWLEAIRIWRWLKKNLRHFLVFLTVKTLILLVYELLKITYYNKVILTLCYNITFLLDFATYSTDKPNFYQILKFLH